MRCLNMDYTSLHEGHTHEVNPFTRKSGFKKHQLKNEENATKYTFTIMDFTYYLNAQLDVYT